MSKRYTYPEVRDTVSEAEWAQRVCLAGCYRLLAHYRMTDLIYTHVSARVPGTAGEFLINPYGLMFDEISASNLVKVDHEGRSLLDATGLGCNPAGFVIHSCIHRARADLHCVIHTHTAAGIGVAAQTQGLRMLSQHAMRFHGALSYHDYEGVALDADEQPRLVRDLGPTNKAMVLRNHGLLTAGATVREAFDLMFYLERACQAQVAALAGGAEVRECSEAIAAKVARQFSEPDGSELHDWPALMRMLNRLGESYAD
ncbi:Ribulose-5-phosphate 4-epimerase/Fuculose-1-phosphate aldolase [Variovorax sp. YR750]|uniref:class II aldolase/adducin family protein n=1 Tax=Variovorax sp. YR750 TaxID=1884384 RepID=UPI0008CFB7C3|nr:class II aldolase/adducin family protein [Variovorax sp. YR750]SEL04548.1 Ribulose-5-phosphate 4-epimerase/Fuculose-1-phosphate aldolase [Variovorax sp. YR750]